MDDLLKQAIDRYGKTLQTFVAIEEMSELTKELVKNMRGSDNHESIVEELADVYIMLDQIQIMNGINLNEVVAKMHEKLERLKERLEHEFV